MSVGSAVLFLPVYLAANGFRVPAAPLSDILFQATFQGIAATVLSLFLYGKAITILGGSAGAAFGALVTALARDLENRRRCCSKPLQTQVEYGCRRRSQRNDSALSGESAFSTQAYLDIRLTSRVRLTRFRGEWTQLYIGRTRCIRWTRRQAGRSTTNDKQRRTRERCVARLPLIDPETTGGDLRAAFDRMPVKLNIFRMMAHAEANALPVMRLGNSILHKQKLSAVNRELLILQAAQLEGGAYEWRQHVPIALGVGVTQAQIDAVERGHYDDAALNAAERALLGFGREVVEKVRVGDAAFAGVRKHFSDQEIVEAIVALGFYMMMARLTEATETDLDPAAGMAVYEGGKKRS